MTNKELIDHCNSFCPCNVLCSERCPYIGYCDVFMAKHNGNTPYLENKYHEKWYTDEEIEA